MKTVVLFFEKGAPTRKVWFYQLDPGRNMGKTNPLNDADLAEFIKLQKTFADSPKSWSLKVADIDKSTFDLARTISISQVVEDVKKLSSKWIKTPGPEFAVFAW